MIPAACALLVWLFWPVWWTLTAPDFTPRPRCFTVTPRGTT